MALLHSGKTSLWMQHLFSYTTPTKLRPTAWLDGLRGVAAFEVTLFHYADVWTLTDMAYGVEGSRGQWLRLPMIRSFYNSGRAMVCVFFVISGIVLTQRTLMLLRRHDMEAAYSSLTSSVFRRALRLFPSPVISTFMALLLFRIFRIQPFGSNEETVPYFPSILDQIAHWTKDTVRYLNLFEPNLKSAIVEGQFIGHAYANIVWTIPMEFAGSLACYIQVLGTAKLQPRVRNAVLLGTALWAIMTYRWALFNFNIGIILGDVMLAESLESTQSASHHSKLGYILLFLAGIYMAGMPMRGPLDSHEPAFGYNTIWRLTPERLLNFNFNFTWWSLAGIAILWSCYRLAFLRRILEGGFCQYLGKLSFAIYLTHIMVRDCIGQQLKTILLYQFGCDEASSAIRQTIPLLLWYAVLLVVTFFVSGLFEKHIDVHVIQFAKYVEERMTALDKAPADVPLQTLPTASV
ncbi:acyltransferase 3 [Protomyces lactucae-debilis]|uniref:Acyltransferase 3 n=1 Tax=Protomyces lactucae-debilis TaxID=2754530 RepID=A0A1Y2EXI8_PROLT|nr:acyltransferase 3 [Protomyces lactucae-debilis]ORY76309.1 acyltransferase 3 [Protomyces lactucae-debilis]